MTKETLLRCRHAALAVSSTKRRIRALRSDAQAISGVYYSSEPRSKGEPLSRQQRYVEALEQLSAEYEKTLAHWVQLAAEVERAVRDLPPQMAELMRLRYVDGCKWEEVNERMYISPATSKRLHRAALMRMGSANCTRD